MRRPLEYGALLYNLDLLNRKTKKVRYKNLELNTPTSHLHLGLEIVRKASFID